MQILISKLYSVTVFWWCKFLKFPAQYLIFHLQNSSYQPFLHDRGGGKYLGGGHKYSIVCIIYNKICQKFFNECWNSVPRYHRLVNSVWIQTVSYYLDPDPWNHFTLSLNLYGSRKKERKKKNFFWLKAIVECLLYL